MGRIAKVSTTKHYNDARLGSIATGEHRDCAVVAFQIVTGLTYAESHDALKKAGRKDRKGTYPDTIAQALAAKGFKYRKWTYLEMKAVIESYPGVHSSLKHITTHHPRRFAKAWAEVGFGRKLLMFTDSHVAAYKELEVHDWSQNSARRVTTIWEII